jgi:hypothetical protein
MDAKATGKKHTFPAALIVLTTQSMLLTPSHQTEVAPDDFLISSDNLGALR